MGIFISKCKSCDHDINWFIEAPKQYVCGCGVFNSAKEIEDSYRELYKNHIEGLKPFE